MDRKAHNLDIEIKDRKGYNSEIKDRKALNICIEIKDVKGYNIEIKDRKAHNICIDKWLLLLLMGTAIDQPLSNTALHIPTKLRGAPSAWRIAESVQTKQLRNSRAPQARAKTEHARLGNNCSCNKVLQIRKPQQQQRPSALQAGKLNSSNGHRHSRPAIAATALQAAIAIGKLNSSNGHRHSRPAIAAMAFQAAIATAGLARPGLLRTNRLHGADEVHGDAHFEVFFATLRS